MTQPSIYNIPNFSRFSVFKYSRFNISESESDICVFVREYKDRIKRQLIREEENEKTPFVSFAEHGPSVGNVGWLNDNHKRFFENTPNESLLKHHFLSELGAIYCMAYSPDGQFIVTGHSTGLIQDSRNEVVYHRWYLTESGYITALEYAPNGSYIIVGHSTGLIQMRHGHTGVVLYTLRNIQFPPKPVYSFCFSTNEDRVCYASCMDGTVYRIEIPNIQIANEETPALCIRADPALECLNVQFYGTPGLASYATPFISQRSPALSMDITADQSRMIIGYGDTSLKIYDMETQEAEATFKVHKLRLQFIPKKLQRMHAGQVCAVRCHDQKPNIFASAAWDTTLRIWDVRCKVGCVMTFEGVNICSDSIDLNRDQCIAGSWQPTEALGVWDLVARKRLNIIRVQNRRPDVDGEYIYACRYWRSHQFNRKGKYCIIGGSGTNCVEVINLHNRYITCSYPAPGTVLAVTSHEERIAFGGTAPVFNIVTFYDPKHEKYETPEDKDYDIMKSVTLFPDDNVSDGLNSPPEPISTQTKSVLTAASTAASMTAASVLAAASQKLG